MKNKISMIAGVAIFAVAMGLSLQNAFNGYGVKDGKMHPEVLAQTDTGGGGTTSSGGGGSTPGGGTTVKQVGGLWVVTVPNKKTAPNSQLYCSENATVSCTFNAKK